MFFFFLCFSFGNVLEILLFFGGGGVVNRGSVKFAPQKKLVAGLQTKGEAAETQRRM